MRTEPSLEEERLRDEARPVDDRAPNPEDDAHVVEFDAEDDGRA